MAGIGFSLRKLFDKSGVLALCRAYGYAGVITIGPMLLGVLLLVGMAFISNIGGLDPHLRELLNCMLTYTLLGSLTVTSWFNMGITRFVSDMLYQKKNEKIIPSFHGVCSIMLVIGGVGYGIFLAFSGANLIRCILCLWLLMILIIVWTEVIYLTAIKDYRQIVAAFAISLMAGFLLALIFILLGLVYLETMLFSVIVAYGILACWNYRLMLDYFPRAEGSNFSFLRWMDKYRKLVLGGGFLNIGLFSHLIIMYFGPLRVQVEGLFYGAPQYDVPALIAFFSVLVTTVGFVTSVEVRFYPMYSNYYGLFNDRGAIGDIKHAGEEMLAVLRRELTFVGHKQMFTTILFIVIMSALLQTLPLGMSSLAINIFRFLCVGYGAYAVANTNMLILLYFEDYMGAMTGCALFAIISTAGTIVQISVGEEGLFGLSFIAGAVVFYIFTILRLEWYTKRLPYFLLSRQSVVPHPEKGLFAAIAGKLDRRAENIRAKREAELIRLARREMEKQGMDPKGALKS
ncbi:MAG: exopolysaccharide Pel transporter PelG [Lachnospiraceae bacterium]|jgi:uncharacterized membrane protein